MENTKISRRQIEIMKKQNEEMRKLLEQWPAREIMMDYEKSWDEKRREFLENNPPLNLFRDESIQNH